MTLLAISESALPRGMAGEQRRLFDRIVETAGGDPSAIEHVGVHSTTKIKEAKEGYPSMEALLAERRPTKVIALGGTAATITKRSPKKIAITRTRGMGEWLEYEGGRAFLVTSVSPEMTLRRVGAISDAQVGYKSSLFTGTGGSREWFRDLYRDVSKWVEQDEPMPYPDLAGRTRVVRTRAELERAVSELDAYEVISCDLETEPSEESLADLRAREHDHSKASCPGCSAWEDEHPESAFDPLTARIMTVGLGTVGGPQVLFHRRLLEQPGMTDLLYETLWTPGRRTVFHNAKFDLKFLAAAIGYHAPVGALGGDTQLLSWLLDERPVRSMYRTHGLKDIARYRYDIPDYHFDWARFWHAEEDERDWDSLHHYHALDIHNTARLWWDLVDEAEEDGVLGVHDGLVWPASLAVAETELRGINVDRGYLEDYRRRLDRRIDRRLRALRAATNDPEFNPASGKEVEALVFDEDPGFGLKPVAAVGWFQNKGQQGENMGGERGVVTVKRNSRKEQLEKLADEQADRRQARILRMIVDYRHDVKARETYAEGLLRSSAVDGRVHSSFNLGGTVTGRLSSSDPNLQNIPKRGPTADAIRRAFTAPDGWLLMDADYSQLELRVAAMLSQDEAFAAVYREGRDIHTEVSAVMFKKDAKDIDYLERYLAKAVDFGAIYGRSGAAISAGAEMEYFEKKMGGTKWTAPEAQEFVDRFLDGFPNLRRWMARVSEEAVTNHELQTPFGRKRRFPFILKADQSAIRRQAFNTPIQSVASDICLSAFVRLNNELDPDEARVLVTIHDSIMLEVREDALARVAAQVKRTMEDVPAVVKAINPHGVPFDADVKVGRTWMDGDMHELEGAE